MTSEDSTRKFFDGRADDYYSTNYEQPRSRHAHNLSLRRAACLRLIPMGSGPVLDLGCGPGAMTIPLVRSGRTVVSTDLSGEMVADTARRVRGFGYTPHVAIADACLLPLPDEAFDVVVTTGVLEYVPDLAKAMREIARVLRPGGAVIATMSLPRKLERFAERTLARLKSGSGGARQYIYDRAGFDAVVESARLRIDARECCCFAPFPLDMIAPSAVPWIDKTFGGSLNEIGFACDRAKTYIVRALR